MPSYHDDTGGDDDDDIDDDYDDGDDDLFSDWISSSLEKRSWQMFGKS